MSELLATILVLLVILAAALVGAHRLRSRRSKPASAPSSAAPAPTPLAQVSPPARVEVPKHIFICYRREDSADITGRIYDDLVDEFGRETFFKDVDSIRPGRDFRIELEKSLQQCHVMLVVVGRAWMAAAPGAQKRRLEQPSDFVRIEIESALKRDIPVIPVLVQGASMPDEELLPPTIRDLVYRQALPIRPDPDFHNDKGRLIGAIREILSRP